MYIYNDIDILHKIIFYILLYFKFEKFIYLSHAVSSVNIYLKYILTKTNMFFLST